MAKTRSEINNAYAKKAYDSLRIIVPKGRKQAIEAHAMSKGESVNGLVNALLRTDMGITDAEWKEQPKEEGD